jgi:hypothetical protein
MEIVKKLAIFEIAANLGEKRRELGDMADYEELLRLEGKVYDIVDI